MGESGWEMMNGVAMQLLWVLPRAQAGQQHCKIARGSAQSPPILPQTNSPCYPLLLHSPPVPRPPPSPQSSSLPQRLQLAHLPPNLLPLDPNPLLPLLQLPLIIPLLHLPHRTNPRQPIRKPPKRSPNKPIRPLAERLPTRHVRAGRSNVSRVRRRDLHPFRRGFPRVQFREKAVALFGPLDRADPQQAAFVDDPLEDRTA